MEVKDDNDKNLRQHNSFVATYYGELMNFLDIDESNSDDGSSDFNMFNPNLIEFNFVLNEDSNLIFVLSVTVESLLLSPEQFYFMGFQLNDSEKCFFSFIMKYIMKIKTVFKSCL